MWSYILAVAIAVGIGLVIGLINLARNNKPLITIWRVRKGFQSIVHQRVPSAKVLRPSLIDVQISTYRNPDVWIATSTEEERAKLQSDSSLLNELREILLQAGYPMDDVPLVQFVFESQQSVDQQFHGHWWLRKQDWLRRNG